MIPTYVTKKEAARLRELARGKVVLELGAQYGFSTVTMGEVARQVWSIDWHQGDPQAGIQDTLNDYLANVRALRLSGAVVPVVGRFEDVLPQLRPGSFDLIFHDGYHGLADMVRDFTLALPLLRWAGVLAVHDWPNFDVEEACRGVLGEPHQLVEHLAIWRSLPGRSHL